MKPIKKQRKKEEVCDRTHCASKIFRGEHYCEGYSDFGFAKVICPCSCHKGISVEETMKKITPIK